MVESAEILGVPVAAVNIDSAARQIESWLDSKTQTYVCVTGVHGIIESQKDERLKKIHRDAGMCVPDGMPTVWVGRFYGHKKMRRVYGPDLMMELLKRSVGKNYKHFFYGGAEGVAEKLRDKLLEQMPGLNVAGVHSPPFRPLTELEEKKLGDIMDSSKPDIIWVGLSTPKQEKWMASHIGKLNATVMVGVGAAFDFHAGLLKQAPRWVQKLGLEWLFRLCAEPKRLWRRYFYIVPSFLFLISLQILRLKKR